MARRRTLTDAQISSLPIKQKPYAMPDPEMAGLYIRVRPTGTKVFCAVARAPGGKQVWSTIGPSNIYSVAEARQRAKDAIRCIREGLELAGPETFASVAETWFTRHVQAKGLISAPDLRSMLDRHLIPAWRNREFVSIRRGDVAKLLDQIEDAKGGVVADFALATTRGLCNWYATRSDNYVSPIVKGMRRTDPKARARARILDDNELREVWRVAGDNGTFGAFLRVALLTAQRREKVVAMRWEDISNREWIIPKLGREKGTAGSLVLPEIAMDIIQAQPRFASNPYVFAGRGSSYMQGQSKRKAQFDAKLTGVAPWTVHDLRRTARSLMSRAGVLPHVSERVLGHAAKGVEGIYDRYEYREEKAQALSALSKVVLSVTNPPSAQNIIALRK
jgi:integrase